MDKKDRFSVRFLPCVFQAKMCVIPANYPAPVRLVDAVAATEVSLVENFSRAHMHPVDEFDAFTKDFNPVASIA